MDEQLHNIVVRIAKNNAGLKVAPSFNERIDAYMSRTDVSRLPETKKRIVSAFLCSAAINIARKDRKRLLEAEDVKAALWLYHIPKHEFDECVQASANILKVANSPAKELGVVADTPMTPHMVKIEEELEAWVLKGDSEQDTGEFQSLAGA